MTHQVGDMSAELVRAGLTQREAEVLRAITAGLRNPQIAARLHISVRTVESHIAALLRKLGAADRTALIESAVHMRRTAPTQTALPTPLTSLIGRDNETREVIALLEEHRLVTLIGPGGVGKTRLALRVATVGVDGLTEGIRVADVAPVGAELVSDAFARALGVAHEAGSSPRHVMREVATTTACLLLVDNCEHIIADVAAVVSDLLSVDGQLRVLATSREPLGVSGEVSYPVRTLNVPDPVDPVRAADIWTSDAVRLFVDRAGMASPGFALTDAISPAVAALCRGLDGLPLAIELAASRMRTFGPAELVEHLDHRFDMLAGGARTAPPRQRSLRDTVDWSYQLLKDDERALFDRLGVFPAQFDYEAVESLCRPEDLNGSSVMALLPSLVDKSLISTGGDDKRYYRLLETIRIYAAERLALSGAAAAVTRQRHAAYYLDLAERASRGLRASDQRIWLDRMVMEQPNLRAALAFSIGAADIEVAWRFIAALERFWDMAGQLPEAQDWIQQTLAIGDPPATSATVAGLAAAAMIYEGLDSSTALDLAKRAEGLAVDLDDLSRTRAACAVGFAAKFGQPERARPALLQAMTGFGDDHLWERAWTIQGLMLKSEDLGEKLRWGRESASLFQTLGDQVSVSGTLHLMAVLSLQAGIADMEVCGWLNQSQAAAETAGTEYSLAHAALGFAHLAWLRRDHDRAADIMQRWLPTLRRLGDRRCVGRALFMLGERARAAGQLADAEAMLRDSVESLAFGIPTAVVGWAFESLAALYTAQGRPKTAALFLGVATRTPNRHPHFQPRDDQLRRYLAAELGATAYNDALGKGQGLTPIEVLRVSSLDESTNAGAPRTSFSPPANRRN